MNQNSNLITVGISEPVDDPLGVVVEDPVVENLTRVAGIDAERDRAVVELDVGCVVLERVFSEL